MKFEQSAARHCPKVGPKERGEVLFGKSAEHILQCLVRLAIHQEGERCCGNPCCRMGYRAFSEELRPEIKIKVARIGSQPSREGPGAYFTGSLRSDHLFATGGKANRSLHLS